MSISFTAIPWSGQNLNVSAPNLCIVSAPILWILLSALMLCIIWVLPCYVCQCWRIMYNVSAPFLWILLSAPMLCIMLSAHMLCIMLSAPMLCIIWVFPCYVCQCWRIMYNVSAPLLWILLSAPMLCIMLSAHMLCIMLSAHMLCIIWVLPCYV